jgi:diguanylate cyclase (GGDEF)-like protein
VVLTVSIGNVQEPTSSSSPRHPSRPRRPRRALRFPVGLHTIVFAAGILVLVLGAAGWAISGGPSSFSDVIVVLDLTVGGTILTTGALVGRARAAEGRRDAQVRAIGHAARRMSIGRNPSEVATVLLEEIGRAIVFDSAAVLIAEGDDLLEPIMAAGKTGCYSGADTGRLRTHVGSGLAGLAAKMGPMRIEDARREPHGMGLAAAGDKPESLLAAPMRRDESLVGVITLSRLGSRPFDEDDLRLLGILADLAATAFAGAASLAEAERLAVEQRQLLEMSSSLAGSLDPNDVAALIAHHLGVATSADLAVVSDIADGSGALRTLACEPADHSACSTALAAADGSPAIRRALRDRAMTVVDVEDGATSPLDAARLRAAGISGVVILPLVAKGEPIGVVQLATIGRPAADPEWTTLVRTMAHEAAMALENARVYEEARNLADRDPLTGFFNHRYLHERLAEEVVRSSRTRQPVAVMMLDLDGFKLVNDTFGHIHGDLVLSFAASLIRATLRTSDVAARYGGDEFALILPDTDATEAAAAAERLQTAFRTTPFEADRRSPYFLGASIGISTYPSGGRTPAELLAAADERLYAAKRAGGSLVRTGVGFGDGEPMPIHATQFAGQRRES